MSYDNLLMDIDVEKLLSYLVTDEGREHAVGILVKRYFTGDPKYAEPVLQALEKSGGYYTAGKICFQAAQYERAMAYFEKSGSFVEAEKCARRLKDSERADIYHLLVSMNNRTVSPPLTGDMTRDIERMTFEAKRDILNSISLLSKVRKKTPETPDNKE